MSTGAQGLEPISSAITGHKHGAGWEVQQPEYVPAPIRNVNAAKGGLDCIPMHNCHIYANIFIVTYKPTLSPSDVFLSLTTPFNPSIHTVLIILFFFDITKNLQSFDLCIHQFSFSGGFSYCINRIPFYTYLNDIS